MRPFLSAILTVTLAVLGVVGVLYVVIVRPWVRVPRDADIDTRWAQIESWADFGALAQGDASNLIKAELAVEEARADLDAALARDGGALPRLRAATLPAAGQVALRALVDWDAGGGGLGQEACAEAVEGMPLLTLGRALLSISESRADAPHALLALRLAAALRGSGDLRKVTVGYHIADEARRWLQERGLRPTAAYADLRPKREDVFPAVARDVVCTWGHSRARLEAGGVPALLSSLPAELSAPVLAIPFLSVSRELRVYQQYHGERLVFAAEVRDNLLRLEPRTRTPAPEDLPESVLLRATLHDASSYVARWRQVIESYETMLRAWRLYGPPLETE